MMSAGGLQRGACALTGNLSVGRCQGVRRGSRRFDAGGGPETCLQAHGSAAIPPRRDGPDAERWQSGRMRRSRKPLSVCADPGFESLSLRHFSSKRLKSNTFTERIPGGERPCYSGLLQSRGGTLASTPRLVKRRGVFYYRMAVPRHLVDRVGRQELSATLRTSDPVQARQSYARKLVTR